jgi:hypothetical protein
MILFLLYVSSGLAQDVTFPTPSYEGEDLVKVREWEKSWAGKKVNSANVDQLKNLLPEAVYTILKNPKDFGSDDIWFEVVPYQGYKMSKGLIESTKKYAPEAQLEKGKKGLMLRNYGSVAGIPFPRPDLSDPVLAGTQMAWNFDSYTHGDSYHVDGRPMGIVDCKSGLERSAGQLRWMMYWAGRTDVTPKPELPKNKRGIHRTFFQRMTDPPDFADSTVLEVKYKDASRDNDLWVYSSMFRRVRRYTTKQRTDMIDGTDLIFDDLYGWYTHINANNYKFIGQQDLLMWRHQDDPYNKLTRNNGQGVWNGIQRERVKCWVVEVINKDPRYIYSKRIWYLDPENWQMNAQVTYHKKGMLWKVFEWGWEEVPGYEGELTTQTNSEYTLDMIRRHGSVGQTKIKEVGVAFPQRLFSIAEMQQKSY